MCDTFVATHEATAAGGVIFGKNSDREPNEAQALELEPARVHEPEARLRCTYLEIPQVSRTARVLLSRPHWMWGAEMGANEHGVVIGNEAVFTRAPVAESGLLGMDLVRLGLERAATARAAVEVIGALLEEHGQGGVAGHRDERMRYDNSFILADPEEAWVLETAGRAWVAARVRGVRAISNGLTIGERRDRESRHLAAYARDLGLYRGRGALDFARTFSNRPITWAAAAARRRGCSERALRAEEGRITPLTAMRALRRHGDGDRAGRAAGAPLMTVCAHASWWPTRRAGQTTASLVSLLGSSRSVHFATGTAAPCTSVFKPLWLDAGLPELGRAPGDGFDAGALWWRHERMHRAAEADLPRFLAGFASERDALEARLVAEAVALGPASAGARRVASERAFSAAAALDERALARMPGWPGVSPRRLYWQRMNALAGLPRAPEPRNVVARGTSVRNFRAR
ncbi:MAG: C69 family dipeptidase [Sorangiineae bacterium]|nr:C69 family dipeptidase [Polyangiaceae bacterium]MEB2321536.1 C69 family dipeptidase [Sorangiineae bacterium]